MAYVYGFYAHVHAHVPLTSVPTLASALLSGAGLTQHVHSFLDSLALKSRAANGSGAASGQAEKTWAATPKRRRRRTNSASDCKTAASSSTTSSSTSSSSTTATTTKRKRRASKVTDAEVPQHENGAIRIVNVGPDTTTRPPRKQQQRRVRRRTVSGEQSRTSTGSEEEQVTRRPTSIAFLLNDASTEDEDCATSLEGYFSSPASSPSTTERPLHQAAGTTASAASFPFPCHFVLSG